jgi:hypothetical protein
MMGRVSRWRRALRDAEPVVHQTPSLLKWLALAVLVALSVVSCDSDSITAPPASPALITPAPAQVLDNGCPACSDPVKWQFTWTEVPDASEYHLYVIAGTATSPLIDEKSVPFSTYSFETQGTTKVETWTWKVRAKAHGRWSEWSEVRAFEVEPACQDCSSLVREQEN